MNRTLAALLLIGAGFVVGSATVAEHTTSHADMAGPVQRPQINVNQLVAGPVQRPQLTGPVQRPQLVGPVQRPQLTDAHLA
jgi:hypothetical protein